MYRPFSQARQVFAAITNRRFLFRNSICGLYHSSACEIYSDVEEKIQYFRANNDVVSWTSKISGMVRRNESAEAIALLKAMLLSEIRPNYVTVLSVIRAVGALESENMTRVIHGLVMKMGFESELSVVTALLGVYSVWDVEIVWKLFVNVPNKDVVLWSAMVSGCVKNGEYLKSFEFFREMQFFGVQPNQATVVSVLPACAELSALQFGKQIHGFSMKKVFYSHTNVQNALVNMYAKCRNFRNSVLVFNHILDKDLISWRSMMRGCIENECPERALNLISEMRFCFHELDEIIVREAIGACTQADEHIYGHALQCLLLKSGFLAFVPIATALLQMYANFGELQSAKILFEQLKQKDLIAWSAMISAYSQSELPCNAFLTFKQMVLASEKPNEMTFVSLLQACSSTDTQEIAQTIHAHIIRAGFSSNPFLGSALIDAYCKFGRIREGKALFDENTAKDLICWSSMINGYGFNGCGTETLQTFLNMLQCGIKPNDVVFVSVLSACSHCGLEYEGWSWFYAMEDKYGVTPKLAHYACMVDLLSRQGNVEEAFAFVNRMPIEPDRRILGSLLAGCRIARNCIEIAEQVAYRLISMDPKNTSYYIILSNLYAEEGRWEDVERLRQLVEKEGLKKEMGYSMIEANS